MSAEARPPGFYWVKRDAEAEWEIVEVHPSYRGVQEIDAMGWEAGIDGTRIAEWGQRIAPLEQPPVHVAVFDDGRFEFVRRFSVLAEAQAFRDGIEACPSLHSTGESVYLLPEQEATMRLDQHGDEVAKAEKAIAAADEVAT